MFLDIDEKKKKKLCGHRELNSGVFGHNEVYYRYIITALLRFSLYKIKYFNIIY